MESSGTATGDLAAYLETTGAVAPVDANGYVTLTAATHFVPLAGARGALLEGVEIVTDGTIAFTATIETCNMPRDKIQGGGLVTDYEASSVCNWIKEDPTGAYVASVGTGWTWTLLTGAKTAGIGGSMIHLGNLGARRVRVKLVVGTGGKVRINSAGKA